MSDLKFAIRQLRKNPGFTAVAVLTLALGIGANTVVFSVTKTVLFHSIGFDAPDRLMWIRLANTESGSVEDRLSWREIQDIREGTTSFDSIATFGAPGAIWNQADGAVEVSALRVTPGLAEVLRIRPVLGRMIATADLDADAEPVVMISDELWQSHFGSSPDVIGQTVRLDEKSRAIIGVLPPGLRFPFERTVSLRTGGHIEAGVQSFWFPLSVWGGDDRTSRNARMFLPVARLKPGVSEKTARAELAAFGQRLAADHPETNRQWTFNLVSFRDLILGRTRQAIPILTVAVGLVLLICCVNLANLLLARGVARQRELTVRLALGVHRRRLVRTLLTESVLLALLGGALGIVFAAGSLEIIRVLASGRVPFIEEATLSGAVLAFTMGLSVVAGLMFGLLPSVYLTRAAVADSLRTGPRTTGNPQVRLWQRRLLIGQVAIVLPLLASAGLLLESFRRLVNQDLGYRTESVVLIDLSTWGFKTNGELCRMYRALRERLAALPGVVAVGTSSSAPLTAKWTFEIKAQVLGHPLPEAERPSLAATFVAFDYFQAMGIPLLEGRFFRDAEMKDDGYGQNVILNETAADLLFPGRSAVGGRFTVGRDLEVIGVVKDTREVSLAEKPQPHFYWQYAFGGAQVVVRSATPGAALIPALRETVQQTDPRILRMDFHTMKEIVAGTVAERRFLMLLLAAYAGVSLLIAVVGILGICGHQVAQRTFEFGVRLALGASPSGLLRLVFVQSGRLVLTGLALGLVLSLVAGRLLASQVFELSPYDPEVLGTVSLAFFLVALLASFLPARRAARTNPMEVLRNE